MQALTSSKIAIIGQGNLGQSITKILVKNDQRVIITCRNMDNTIKMAERIGELATPMSIRDAIINAGMMILAIGFNQIKEFINKYGTLLEGKIIIDPSNPIEADKNGAIRRIIGEDESAGQILASLLPKGAKLAKAFCTLGSVSLAKYANQTPQAVVLYYATDNIGINYFVEQLIRKTGFEPNRIGSLEKSSQLEAFGDLNEIGAHGTTITDSEAKLELNENFHECTK